MKILFIELCNYHDYPLGGQLSFAKHLARAMEGEIDLVGCSTNPSEPLQVWTKKQIEGYSYNFFNVCFEKNSAEKPFMPRRIKDYYYVRKCRHLLHFEDYDCVALQAPEVMLALPDNVLKKSCLIMPGVGNPLQISRYHWARSFSELYDRAFFSKAHFCRCILAAADTNALTAFVNRSKGKIDKDKVLMFPTRYDADIFNRKDRKALRSKYGLENDVTVFVTTGRLNWFKGWKLMIDAFRIFIKHSSNSLLLFIGDGEDHEKIVEYAKKEVSEGRIALLGRKPLNEVSEYLSLADEFIMGSFAEGWSTSLVEAVASGLPCVVTDFSSAEEMVKDGDNGYVLKNRDADQFAKRMADALSLDNANILKMCDDCQKLSVQNMKTEFFKLIRPYFS